MSKRRTDVVPATRESVTDIPRRLFRNQSEWEAWLAGHCISSPGLWLRIAKKSANLKSVTYQQALEVALCYGWIDGQKKSHDDESWLQKFTPRGPRSIWSKINRAKAQALIKEGRMRAPGLAAIEIAKKNGRWDAAYDSQRSGELPEEFRAALEANPKAKAFYATLNSANRYSILFRLQTAKREETRRKRIAQFVRMLEKHEKLHP
jgi:uncharacterized protein YdeI (YjbR/CyaY-like superfamily)